MANTQFDQRNRDEVNAIGVIVRPGKFEGEMWWVPELWDEGGDDLEDTDGTLYMTFEITAEDRKRFGILKDVAEVWLWESEQGFVNSRQLTKKEADKAREQIEAAWDDDYPEE